MKCQQAVLIRYSLLRNQNVMDGQMDGRTDGTHKTIYPPQTQFAEGGLDISYESSAYIDIKSYFLKSYFL